LLRIPRLLLGIPGLLLGIPGLLLGIPRLLLRVASLLRIALLRTVAAGVSGLLRGGLLRLVAGDYRQGDEHGNQRCTSDQRHDALSSKDTRTLARM
jgi:hypothetical protein